MKIVLYDQDCPLCTFLAKLIHRNRTGAVSVQSWEIFLSGQPQGLDPKLLNISADELGAWDGKDLLLGAQAWDRILDWDPAFAPFGWIASKLGIRNITASALNQGGHIARKLCRTCGRRNAPARR